MGMLSSQADELRTMAGELRRVYEHNTDWLRDEAVTLASSVDSMREAADTIESMRDRLQPVPAELDYIEDKSRWYEMFGTPEHAARTLEMMCDMSPECSFCPLGGRAESICGEGDYDALLEWLRGDAE